VSQMNNACILRRPHEEALLQELGAAIRAGNLVAFPTETVYGLGANGLDADAVLKIFEAKGRPLSDPCILHVASAEDALGLLELTPLEKTIFQLLTAACWPGPLSIVARALPCVPREVTASTDFVAVRCPAHRLAQDLLRAARVPVAAPSANRFGHISPTLAEHVLEDLVHVQGLRILDGGPCEVGIESTVVKLDLPQGLLILRRGGVTRQRIEAALAAGLASGALSEKIPVCTPPSDKPFLAPENEAQQSPGMMLRHYAPSVPTVLLAVTTQSAGGLKVLPELPECCILIDFGSRLQQHKVLFKHTFDLCYDGEQSPGTPAASGVSAEGSSEPRDPAEAACARVFAVLRDAEAYALKHSVGLICIGDFATDGCGGYDEALRDRIFRAASGQRVNLCLGGSPCFVAAAS